MTRLMVGVLLGLMFPACKSRPLGPYTTPRVTGLVFAADTKKPLPGVKVIRDSGEPKRISPPKGGELLMRKAPAQTDKNGHFELPGERVLSVVRGSDWNLVSLTFDHAGYQHFRTNCLVNPGTNATTGELFLDVGQIYLLPVGK